VAGSFTEDYSHFNQFIDGNILFYLPLCGKNFTWFRGDGVSMSRLDRFLLSEDWCTIWPNMVQRALNRGLSDHCPILLSMDDENWGPRPRRMLKCWGDLPSYKQFVRDNLQFYHIEGWGGFVLKEKLMIKGSLNTLHLNHTQNLEGRLTNVQDRISFLDAKGEEDDLLLEEIEELHSLSSDFRSLSRINTNMQWQKSRLLWLKEGDANTKFYYNVMSSRRRVNSIFSLSINSAIVEGVEGIRGLVFNNFSSHFQYVAAERPCIENLSFNKLNVGQCGELTKPFSVDEVKQVV